MNNETRGDDFKDWTISDLESHVFIVNKILEEKKAHYRWEVGFRNIATIMVGPRASYEIDDIVEMVRSLKEEAENQIQQVWCECLKSNAYSDNCGNCGVKNG